ncbi:MAG: phosphatase PAP2 family protein [Bacteroidetes bacterium]|nr:phosphatase PAP2 family protein [Bacteroidota bacterium]
MNPDLAILYFFNHTCSAEWLDPVMIALTGVKFWAPIYVLSAVLVVYYRRWEGVRLVVSTILLIAVANTVTNVAVKPLVARQRPCAEIAAGKRVVEDIRLPDGPRYGDSFPSSHALNNFAGVVFFILIFPRKKWLYWLFVPATVICITRMYLGVHYPSDVLGGMALGALTGYLWAKLHRVLERRLSGR